MRIVHQYEFLSLPQADYGRRFDTTLSMPLPDYR
jgi:hypothetical protein